MIVARCGFHRINPLDCIAGHHDALLGFLVRRCNALMDVIEDIQKGTRAAATRPFVKYEQYRQSLIQWLSSFFIAHCVPKLYFVSDRLESIRES